MGSSSVTTLTEFCIASSVQRGKRQEEQLAPSIKFIGLTDLTISYLKVATGRPIGSPSLTQRLVST